MGTTEDSPYFTATDARPSRIKPFPSRKRKATVDASTTSSDFSQARRKKLREDALGSQHAPICLEDDDEHVDGSAKRKSVMKKAKKPDGEKRLRRWREKAPGSYMEVFDRAMTQRMFVIERQRSGPEACPEETVELAGTTGNIYTINITQLPSCDCPHAKKGNQCKHIIYVLCRVLHAPAHLQYQLAFLRSELHEIFANAPPILTADNTSRDGNRKPVEDDCPICCCEFEPKKEEIVFCKAACGNNIHKLCFEQWAASKKGASGGVTCPFCRTPWRGDEDMVKKIARCGKRNADGYVNVAQQLGISASRGELFPRYAIVPSTDTCLKTFRLTIHSGSVASSAQAWTLGTGMTKTIIEILQLHRLCSVASDVHTADS